MERHYTITLDEHETKLLLEHLQKKRATDVLDEVTTDSIKGKIKLAINCVEHPSVQHQSMDEYFLTNQQPGTL